MPTQSKPISIEEINKIELRNDGKDGKRFESMLHTVVKVPREEILRREAKAKKQATKLTNKAS